MMIFYESFSILSLARQECPDCFILHTNAPNKYMLSTRPAHKNPLGLAFFFLLFPLNGIQTPNNVCCFNYTFRENELTKRSAGLLYMQGCICRSKIWRAVEQTCTTKIS